jgi:hypothetical protein
MAVNYHGICFITLAPGIYTETVGVIKKGK